MKKFQLQISNTIFYVESLLKICLVNKLSKHSVNFYTKCSRFVVKISIHFIQFSITFFNHLIDFKS